MKTFSAAVRDAVGSEEPIATGGGQNLNPVKSREVANSKSSNTQTNFTTAHDAVG